MTVAIETNPAAASAAKRSTNDGNQRGRLEIRELIKLHHAAEAVDHQGSVLAHFHRGPDLRQPLLHTDPPGQWLVLGSVPKRSGEAAAAGVEDLGPEPQPFEELAIGP